MLLIRNFAPSDLNRVYEIERQSFKDPYHVMFLLNLYELYSTTFFVAEVESLVVGYVISRRVDTSGHVIAIAVAPEHRNRGIGTALMQAVMQKFKEMSLKDVWLEVRMSNTAARQFYKNLGFEERRIVSLYYSDGESAVILRKGLV